MILKGESKTVVQKNFGQERDEMICEVDFSFDYGMNEVKPDWRQANELKNC